MLTPVIRIIHMFLKFCLETQNAQPPPPSLFLLWSSWNVYSGDASVAMFCPLKIALFVW